MPIIASQHAADPWRPLLAWPATTHVQWGGRGIVLGRPGTTAFFEAFPADGSAGFIRGEGATVDAAEVSAFQQWTKQHACFSAGEHLWTRTPRRKYQRGKPLGTYTNTGGFCLRCGSFKCVMLPIVTLGDWSKPLDSMGIECLTMGMGRPDSKANDDSRKHSRRLLLKASVMGIRMPPITPPEPDFNLFRPDAYVIACRRAVKSWLLAQAEMPKAGENGDDIAGFFSSLSSRSLRRLIEEIEDDEEMESPS